MKRAIVVVFYFMFLSDLKPGIFATDSCKISISSLEPATARRINVTSSLVPCGRGSQTLVRGMYNVATAAPWHRRPLRARKCTSGRPPSRARCLMMAKHQCFGPVSGLEVRRTLMPDKPWKSSSLTSMAFSWQTQNGAKQPRAKVQTTSKLALGTGRRPGGSRPPKRWPKPWLSTTSRTSSLRFTKTMKATTTASCTTAFCTRWS